MGFDLLINPPKLPRKVVGRVVLLTDINGEQRRAPSRPVNDNDPKREAGRQRSKEWYAKNRDYQRAKVRARKAARRDELRAQKRAYYEQNIDTIRIKQRLYYMKNRERILARVKAAYEAKKAKA